MRRIVSGALVALFCAVLASGPARAAGDPAAILAAAKRLACAFTHGVNAGFDARGNVSIRPPLDPNTPGLTIVLVDPAKKRAILEEDNRETPGAYILEPSGLYVVARYPDGGMALITVYPIYSGASDNFLMVASHQGAATMPKVSQRYGLCRVADTPPPPPPPAPPAAGHGHS